MAPVTCFADGCLHTEGSAACSFYLFPQEDQLKQKWILKCRGNASRMETTMAKVCSCHFLESGARKYPELFKYNHFGNIKLNIQRWPFDLLKSLTNMKDENFLCDVTIVTKQHEELHCHSLVLAAGSPVLQRTIKSHSKGDKKISGMRITTAFDSASWKAVLGLFYTGKLVILPAFYADCLELMEVLAIPHVIKLVTSNSGGKHVGVPKTDRNIVTDSYCTAAMGEWEKAKDGSAKKTGSVGNVVEKPDGDPDAPSTVIVHQSSSHTVYESVSGACESPLLPPVAIVPLPSYRMPLSDVDAGGDVAAGNDKDADMDVGAPSVPEALSCLSECEKFVQNAPQNEPMDCQSGQQFAGDKSLAFFSHKKACLKSESRATSPVQLRIKQEVTSGAAEDIMTSLADSTAVSEISHPEKTSQNLVFDDNEEKNQSQWVSIVSGVESGGRSGTLFSMMDAMKKEVPDNEPVGNQAGEVAAKARSDTGKCRSSEITQKRGASDLERGNCNSAPESCSRLRETCNCCPVHGNPVSDIELQGDEEHFKLGQCTVPKIRRISPACDMEILGQAQGKKLDTALDSPDATFTCDRTGENVSKSESALLKVESVYEEVGAKSAKVQQVVGSKMSKQNSSSRLVIARALQSGEESQESKLPAGIGNVLPGGRVNSDVIGSREASRRKHGAPPTPDDSALSGDSQIMTQQGSGTLIGSSSESTSGCSNEKINCTRCEDLKFDTLGELEQHQIADHTRETVVNKQAGKSKRLRRKQDKKKRRKFMCDVCGKVCASQDGLHMHGYLHRGEVFACGQCGKAFRSPRYLRKHVHMVHSAGGVRFPCAMCAKSFKVKSGLNHHVRFEHDAKRKMNVCTICGKGFRFPVLLRQHIDWHNGAAAFTCDQCGKKCYTKAQYNMHLRSHSDEKCYECHLCARKFKHSSTLKEHVRMHDVTAEGEAQHRCEQCEQTFRQKKNLLAHVRNVHLRERKHWCDVCQKAFSRNSLLREHLLTSIHAKQVRLKAEAQQSGIELSTVRYTVKHYDKEIVLFEYCDSESDVKRLLQAETMSLPSEVSLAGSGPPPEVSHASSFPVEASQASSASRKLLNIVQNSLQKHTENQANKETSRTILANENRVNFAENPECVVGRVKTPDVMVIDSTSLGLPVGFTTPPGGISGQALSCIIADGKIQNMSQYSKSSAAHAGNAQTVIGSNPSRDIGAASDVQTAITDITGPVQVHSSVSMATKETGVVDNSGTQLTSILLQPEECPPIQTQTVPVTPCRQGNDGSKFTIDLSDWSVLSGLMKTPDGKQTIVPIAGNVTPNSTNVKTEVSSAVNLKPEVASAHALVTPPPVGRAKKISQFLAAANATAKEPRRMTFYAAPSRDPSVGHVTSVAPPSPLTLQAGESLASSPAHPPSGSTRYVTLQSPPNVIANPSVLLPTPAVATTPLKPGEGRVIAFQSPPQPSAQQVICQSPASLYENQPIMFQTPSPGMRTIQVLTQGPAAELSSPSTHGSTLSTPK